MQKVARKTCEIWSWVFTRTTDPNQCASFRQHLRNKYVKTPEALLAAESLEGRMQIWLLLTLMWPSVFSVSDLCKCACNAQVGPLLFYRKHWRERGERERARERGRERGFSTPCWPWPWLHLLPYDSRTHFSYILVYIFLSVPWLAPSWFSLFLSWLERQWGNLGRRDPWGATWKDGAETPGIRELRLEPRDEELTDVLVWSLSFWKRVSSKSIIYFGAWHALSQSPTSRLPVAL